MGVINNAEDVLSMSPAPKVRQIEREAGAVTNMPLVCVYHSPTLQQLYPVQCAYQCKQWDRLGTGTARRLRDHCAGLSAITGLSWSLWQRFEFLADRTKTVALMLQCCVRLSFVCTECTSIVVKRCDLEQKLLLTARNFRKLYMINRLVPKWMTWPWPLFRGRIKVMSTIALHSTLNISESVRDRSLVPMDHQ